MKAKAKAKRKRRAPKRGGGIRAGLDRLAAAIESAPGIAWSEILAGVEYVSETDFEFGPWVRASDGSWVRSGRL